MAQFLQKEDGNELQQEDDSYLCLDTLTIEADSKQFGITVGVRIYEP